MATAKKFVKVTDAVKAKAIEKVKSMLASLDTHSSADSIAVQLYREKVRGARCGDTKKCALAQYFANAMPKGVYVTVAESADVELYDAAGFRAGDPFFGSAGSGKIDEFISNFDEGMYGFLQKK